MGFFRVTERAVPGRLVFAVTFASLSSLWTRHGAMVEVVVEVVDGGRREVSLLRVVEVLVYQCGAGGSCSHCWPGVWWVWDVVDYKPKIKKTLTIGVLRRLDPFSSSPPSISLPLV